MAPMLLPLDDLSELDPHVRTTAQIEIHPGRRTNNSIRIMLCDSSDQPYGILTIGEDIIRWAPAKTREVSFSPGEFAKLLERRY
jgi:hypothetical protein